MIYLTRSALVYAANICEELPRYRVRIAVPSMDAENNIVNIISMNIEDDKADFRISKTNSSILFSNGSYIDIFVGNENSRCKKAHLLIVDKTINEEFVSCVLIPMEAWDYYKTSILFSQKEVPNVINR